VLVYQQLGGADVWIIDHLASPLLRGPRHLGAWHDYMVLLDFGNNRTSQFQPMGSNEGRVAATRL
jgi:hypothetical protein